MQAQVSRAVANSPMVVVQSPPVLVGGHQGRPNLGSQIPILGLPFQSCFERLHTRGLQPLPTNLYLGFFV